MTKSEFQVSLTAVTERKDVQLLVNEVHTLQQQFGYLSIDSASFPRQKREVAVEEAIAPVVGPSQAHKSFVFQSKMLFCCQVLLEFIAQVEMTQLTVMFCISGVWNYDCCSSTILLSMPDKDFVCRSTQNIKKWLDVLLHPVTCFSVWSDPQSSEQWNLLYITRTDPQREHRQTTEDAMTSSLRPSCRLWTSPVHSQEVCECWRLSKPTVHPLQ